MCQGLINNLSMHFVWKNSLPTRDVHNDIQHMQDHLNTNEGILLVVTIKIDPSKRLPENNVSLFFDGNKIRYYIHANNDQKLYIVQVPFPVDKKDWKTHMQFTNSYATS